MPVSFRCPECKKGLSARETMAGKKVRCPGCGNRIAVPLPEAMPAEPVATGETFFSFTEPVAAIPVGGSPSAPPLPNQGSGPGSLTSSPISTPRVRLLPRPWRPAASLLRRLNHFRDALLTQGVLTLSLGWVFLGLSWAIASPWLGLLPSWLGWPWEAMSLLAIWLVASWLYQAGLQQMKPRKPLFTAVPRLPWWAFMPLAVVAWWWGPSNLLPLLITLGLIGWNLWTGTKIVGTTGEVWAALPVSVMQLLLFPLLFFQIATHAGATHYAWEGPPQPWHWIGFAGVHALRAGDLVDVLHAYGLKLQALQHASLLTGICLIIFHLVLDLFLIGVLLDGIKRLGLARTRTKQLGLAAGIFVVVWLISAFFIRPWRGQDLLLWPVENLIRVVDFTDAMEVLHLSLHQVPDFFWEGTLTFLCRLLMAVALLEILNQAAQRMNLRYFGGFGLSRQELEFIRQQHPEEDLRARAERRLQALNNAEMVARYPRNPLHWLSPREWRLVGISAAVLLGTVLVFGNWDRAAAHLADRAIDPQPQDASRALAALARLGPQAADQAGKLASALETLPRERQPQVIETLGALGPKALDALSKALHSDQEELAISAAQALAQLGPQATPVLFRAYYQSPFETVAQSCSAAVERLGLEGVLVLMKQVDTTNEAYALPFIAERDPYCDRRFPGHVINSQLKNYRSRKDSLNQQLAKLSAQQPIPFLQTLARHGATAVDFVPQVQTLLTHADPTVRSQAAETLWAMGLAAAPSAKVLAARLDQEKEFVVRLAILKALAQVGPRGVPGLLKGLEDSTPHNREQAFFGLQSLGKKAVAALPRIHALVADKDFSTRHRAFVTIMEIGSEADKVQMARQMLNMMGGQDTDQANWSLSAIDSFNAMPTVLKQVEPQVLALLEHPKPEVCSKATAIMGRMGNEARDSLAVLVRSLGGSNHRTVLNSLSQIDPKWVARPEVQAVLVELLRHDNSEVRRIAVYFLSKGSLPKAIQASHFANMLEDPDNGVYSEVCTALIETGEGRLVVPRLLEMATKETPSRNHVDLILRIGAKGVPELERALQKGSPGIRLQVIPLIGRLATGPEAFRIFAERLPDLDDQQKSLVFRQLQQIATPPRSEFSAQIPQLAMCLGNGSAEDRRALVKLFTQLGREAREAGPALKARFEDADLEVRRGAVAAFAAVQDPTEAAPVLVGLLQPGQDVELAPVAAQALMRFGSSAGETVPQLLKALAGPDQKLQVLAIQVLGNFGRAAAPALSALEEAQNSKDAQVRQLAAWAVKRLRQFDAK